MKTFTASIITEWGPDNTAKVFADHGVTTIDATGQPAPSIPGDPNSLVCICQHMTEAQFLELQNDPDIYIIWSVENGQ